MIRRFRPFCRLAVGLALLVGLAGTAFARDELRFANGDRISGKVISQEGGKVRFVSEMLGELEVPAANVEVVRNVPDTSPEVLAGLPPQQPKEPVAVTQAPAKPAVTTTTKPATPPAPTPPAQVRPPPPPSVKPAALAKDAERWKGKVEAGFVQQSGRNDRVDVSLRGEAERRFGQKTRLRFEGRALYAETGNVTSNDRLDGSFRWRRDITDRMFGQSVTSGYRDQVKLIDINAEQNVGLGYKVFDRPRHVFNVGTGVTAQYRESPLTEDGWAYLIEAFEDYTWKINGRITLTQNANAVYSLGTRTHSGAALGTTPGNYRLRFNTTLQGKVTEKISANLRFEFEYDATVANPALRDDQRITSSVGYAF